MEAFEHLVKVYLEIQGYAVSTNLKFPVRRKTAKRARDEYQTHGYEVDLLGARSDSLVVGFAKSFLGSKGVDRQGFRGLADETKQTYYPQYRFFNEREISDGVLQEIEKTFGYARDRILVKLFVGRFRKAHEASVRAHLGKMIIGAGPVQVVGLRDILDQIWQAASSKTYINDPVVVTAKALKDLGWSPPAGYE